MLERIKKLAKEQGITIQQLEIRAGLSAGLISKWAKSTPKISKLKPVADILGVSVEYLLTGKEKAPETSTASGVAKRDQALIRWFRSLPPEKQKAILDLQDGPADAL